MDLIPRNVAIAVFAQGALVLLWIFVRSRGRSRSNEAASEPPTESVPLSTQPWVWVAGSMAGLAAILLFLRPCTAWYWSRHPPIVEHRSELLETASKRLNCPADRLAIKPFQDSGAEVTGCDRKIQVCWGRDLTHRSLVGWNGCYVP